MTGWTALTYWSGEWRKLQLTATVHACVCVLFNVNMALTSLSLQFSVVPQFHLSPLLLHSLGCLQYFFQVLITVLQTDVGMNHKWNQSEFLSCCTIPSVSGVVFLSLVDPLVCTKAHSVQFSFTLSMTHYSQLPSS